MQGCQEEIKLPLLISFLMRFCFCLKIRVRIFKQAHYEPSEDRAEMGGTQPYFQTIVQPANGSSGLLEIMVDPVSSVKTEC